MRRVLLVCLAVAFGCAATAQLTLLPQLGLEANRTALTVNDGASFTPLGTKFSPQAAVKLQYAFKKMHGPFIGLATSRPVVQYDFAKPETGAAYTASRGNTQLRLEGGYQVSTKKLYFKKKPDVKNNATSYHQRTEGRAGCSKSAARSGCVGNATKARTKPVDNRTWMRIQPSVGMAYMPAAPRAGIYAKDQSTYQYNAGNWETALVSGVAFQFGRLAQPKYSISLDYVKGLSNLGTQSITTMVSNKPTTTTLKSATSAWSIRMGIPIVFAKKQVVLKQTAVEKESREKKGCTQYRSGCSQYKSSYKARCTRVI
jgi:hypothetical protein